MLRLLKLLGISFLLLLLYFVFYFTSLNNETRDYFKTVEVINTEEPDPTVENEEANTFTIGFAGDVMLARNVENLMRDHGGDYPYRGKVFASSSPGFLVANFEASVPEVHQKTPSGAFQFSVETKYLRFLAEAGFTHVSLANNHTLDHGGLAYKHTRMALDEVGVESFGHATIVSTSSLTYLSQGSTTVAIVGIHTLFSKIVDQDLKAVMAEAKAKSDWQIAYVHWGNEYVELPNAEQTALAQRLVDLGVDLIVGHHPHVIQKIDSIEGVPVFYSLGNFIFDQYFSRAVQEGLVLLVHFSEGKMHQIELLPVTSRYSRSQPHLMKQEEKQKTLDYISKISSESIQLDIVDGVLKL